MEIKIIQGVKREVLEDVFVTAIEGGSNYWYFLSDHAIAKIRRAVPKEEDECISTAILKAILDHDVKVEINDADDEDEVIGVITRGTMQSRLQLLSDSPNRWALEDGHRVTKESWDCADKITHDGFVYVKYTDLVFYK
jgi:hypothetical protein